jgi:serine/threonine protein kinase
LPKCSVVLIKVFKWLILIQVAYSRYFILELCTATLGDFISGKYQGPISADINALLQMAAGVKCIHSNNLVHRDIKPDNVLIANNGQLKISDFGFCKRTTERGTYSLQSGVKGTPNYLAPELLEMIEKEESEVMKRASNASDVFALGCVFYKFLTRGTHPFGSENQIRSNIVNDKYDLSKVSMYTLLAHSTINEYLTALAT